DLRLHRGGTLVWGITGTQPRREQIRFPLVQSPIIHQRSITNPPSTTGLAGAIRRGSVVGVPNVLSLSRVFGLPRVVVLVGACVVAACADTQPLLDGCRLHSGQSGMQVTGAITP